MWCENFSPANNKEYIEAGGYIPPWARFDDLRKLRNPNNQENQKSESNLQKGSHKWKWTPKTSKQVRDAFSKLLFASSGFIAWNRKTKQKERASMATITLTFQRKEKVHRSTGNRLLSKFLHSMKINYGMELYVWVNEDQGRGQLHYHIAWTGKFIDHKVVRRVWNRIQEKAGLLDEWQKAHNNSNPPSTECKALFTEKECSDYMYSYIDKGSQHTEESDGRFWGQSQLLSKANLPLIEFSREQYGKLMKAFISDNVIIKSFSAKIEGKTKEIVMWKKWITRKGCRVSEILTEYNNMLVRMWRYALRAKRLPEENEKLYVSLKDKPPPKAREADEIWITEHWDSRKEYVNRGKIKI